MCVQVEYRLVTTYLYCSVYFNLTITCIDESDNAEERDVDIMVSRDIDTHSGGRHTCPRGV